MITATEVKPKPFHVATFKVDPIEVPALPEGYKLTCVCVWNSQRKFAEKVFGVATGQRTYFGDTRTLEERAIDKAFEYAVLNVGLEEAVIRLDLEDVNNSDSSGEDAYLTWNGRTADWKLETN